MYECYISPPRPLDRFIIFHLNRISSCFHECTVHSPIIYDEILDKYSKRSRISSKLKHTEHISGIIIKSITLFYNGTLNSIIIDLINDKHSKRSTNFRKIQQFIYPYNQPTILLRNSMNKNAQLRNNSLASQSLVLLHIIFILYQARFYEANNLQIYCGR